MSRHPITAAILAVALAPWPVQAAEKTILLDVENAVCELCGPIVKIALARVPGVKNAKVEQHDDNSPTIATVTFEDTLTNVEALILATTNAGYPSHLVN